MPRSIEVLENDRKLVRCGPYATRAPPSLLSSFLLSSSLLLLSPSLSLPGVPWLEDKFESALSTRENLSLMNMNTTVNQPAKPASPASQPSPAQPSQPSPAPFGNFLGTLPSSAAQTIEIYKRLQCLCIRKSTHRGFRGSNFFFLLARR